MASTSVNASPLGLAAPWRAAGSGAILTVLLAASLAVGALGALRPALTLTLCLAFAAGVWVAIRPALGGYLVIAITPLLVGINRGSALPLLRPSEALALAIGIALAARAILSWRAGELSLPRLGRVEAALVLMAVSNSVVPTVWLLARGQAVTTDDVLYAL